MLGVKRVIAEWVLAPESCLEPRMATVATSSVAVVEDRIQQEALTEREEYLRHDGNSSHGSDTEDEVDPLKAICPAEIFFDGEFDAPRDEQEQNERAGTTMSYASFFTLLQLIVCFVASLSCITSFYCEGEILPDVR